MSTLDGTRPISRMQSGGLRYSVIVVTYGRHSQLTNTLQHLSPLIDPLIGELVVVDQVPRIPLPPEIVELPGVRYIVLDRPGMVNARNVGLSAACGEIVLFVDDDVEPTRELIPSHLDAYQDASVGGVAGRVLEPGKAPTLAPDPRVFDPRLGWRYPDFSHAVAGDVMTSRGCNMSFRREVLVAAGGFDPNIEIFRDDTDMCLRVIAAGYSVRFVPQAQLYHLNAPSGGTRSESTDTDHSWSREWRLYQQCYRHYRDNLYFLMRHFRGWDRLQWLADAYRTYVGWSRWPWRLMAKNSCFLLALIRAHRMARLREINPCMVVDFRCK